ncbi:uncharacterized protein LOC143031698 [Oratosquilla oratoria]|uniref:uncharacterized protein LOC143031698 n=1 Tax=Oratosquilla oratoria TaxID=337810 RepID=UPI003F762E3A
MTKLRVSVGTMGEMLAIFPISCGGGADNSNLLHSQRLQQPQRQLQKRSYDSICSRPSGVTRHRPAAFLHSPSSTSTSTTTTNSPPSPTPSDCSSSTTTTSSSTTTTTVDIRTTESTLTSSSLFPQLTSTLLSPPPASPTPSPVPATPQPPSSSSSSLPSLSDVLSSSSSPTYTLAAPPPAISPPPPLPPPLPPPPPPMAHVEGELDQPGAIVVSPDELTTTTTDLLGSEAKRPRLDPAAAAAAAATPMESEDAGLGSPSTPTTEPASPSTPTEAGGNKESYASRRRRFLRTAEVLRESGLLGITMKTAELLRKNQELQREIEQLQAETRKFVVSVLSNPENRPLLDAIHSRAQLFEVIVPGSRKIMGFPPTTLPAMDSKTSSVSCSSSSMTTTTSTTTTTMSTTEHTTLTNNENSDVDQVQSAGSKDVMMKLDEQAVGSLPSLVDENIINPNAVSSFLSQNT